MSLPEALHILDLGETLGHLRTQSTHPFVDPDGTVREPSVWFIVTPTRCWLAATSGGHVWKTADSDVALEKGWTWDAIRVGTWKAALRAGTRKNAVALMETWSAAVKGGPTVLPLEKTAQHTAAVARGGLSLPPWISGLEAPPDAHWLFGVTTAESLPVARPDGTNESLPLWILFSDHHQVLAHSDGYIVPFSGCTHVTRTARRDLLHLDARPGMRVDGDHTTLQTAVHWGTLSRTERWASVLRLAIHRGDAEAASRLLAEAFVDRVASDCWLDAAQLAWASERPRLALRALVAAGSAQAIVRPRDIAVRWLKERLEAPPSLPTGLFDLAPAPELPPTVPWPPEGPMELFAVAASLTDHPAAQELWAHRGRSERALRGMASFASPAEAVDQWSEAARLVHRKDPAKARDLLLHALEIAPPDRTTELYWQAAAWAHASNADPTDHWRKAVAGPPPDTLIQPALAWKRAARIAEEQRNTDTAILAYEKVWLIDAFDREALRDGVRLLELVGRPVDALQWWLELERRERDVPEPTLPLWQMRCTVARLALEVSDLPTAEQALLDALQEGFLIPEAYGSVLRQGAQLFDEDQLHAWRHVQGVIEGRPQPAPKAVPHLTADALDALHPGGIGWLENTRQRLDTQDPPPRNDLVRGLEPVRADEHPLLWSLTHDLSARLGIDPPDVFVFRGEGAYGFAAWPTLPPVVLVGQRHRRPDHPQALSEDGMRFALAAELVHLAAKHPLLAFDGGLIGTSHSVYQTFGRYAGTAETVVDVVTLLPGVDQIAKIQTLVKLSQRVFTARSVVDKATAAMGTGRSLLGIDDATQEAVGRSFEGAALQLRLQADHAALLLTGDLSAAVDAILASEPDTASLRESVHRNGLAAALPRLPADLRVRLASLVAAAARHREV